ncbi:MAG: hypothetical protein JO007_01435 [Alphaproteobacteria bacterium]|nr:hypothetical protein [Alphaproteobacteria bacterium]
MLIALRAVFGQDEVSHGTVRYRVDADGLVLVPPEVARCLVNNAGFEVVKRIQEEQGEVGTHAPQPQNLARSHQSMVRASSDGAPEYCIDVHDNFAISAVASAAVSRYGGTPTLPDECSTESTSKFGKSIVGGQEDNLQQGYAAVVMGGGSRQR